ncbi:MAG: bacteriocin fulvocin C-related protein [Flavobacteriaceae bacterium]|jgi:hypothetical protein|nr:bacteriocin fulvocin C-related protein [Flavobacteriaceae bacterium]
MLRTISFFLLTLCILASCSRNIVDAPYSENKAEESGQIYLSRNEFAKESKSIQIQVLDNLSPKIKVKLFKEKLWKIYTQRIFGDKKNAVIKYAYDNLSDDFFNNKLTQNTLIKSLESKTKETRFTDEEIVTIFFSLDDVVITSGKINNYNNLFGKKNVIVDENYVVTSVKEINNNSQFAVVNIKKKNNLNLIAGGGETESDLRDSDRDGKGKRKCNMEWCLTCGLNGFTYNCDSDCKAVLSGCGWFLQQECTKICKT